MDINNNTGIYDVVVIGGGAAGMMAAIAASEVGAGVVVIEKNKYTGRKIGITGKGRCNVTNNCTVNELLENVKTNPKFLYGAAAKFTPADTMEFFEGLGVKLKTERGRRVFPESDKASDIQFAFDKKLRTCGVKVIYNSAVTGIEAAESGENVKKPWKIVFSSTIDHKSREIFAKSVVIATGGASYPLTGSTGDGHRILAGMGVDVTSLSPSLIPMETREDYSNLSGLALRNVTLTVEDPCGGEVFHEIGEMLFTHFGISGPLVLSASSNMDSKKYSPEQYKFTLNLKPALSREELDARVLSDFAKYSARDFVNSLADLMPQKLIPYVVERSGIDAHKKVANITKEERGHLLDALRKFEIGVKSFRPIEEAIITRGGVSVKEISPKTMELKKFPGIFCAGELIDVDAYTGGYNLQIAFSTGVCAGKSAAYYACD